MRGCVLYGSIMIGLVLVTGQYLLPESVVAWFASDQSAVHAWRMAIVTGLLSLAIIHAHFHNLYLKFIWAVAAIGLGWCGGLYFLDNPSYVFDALLMLGASAAFGIHALLPAESSLTLSLFSLLGRAGHWLVEPSFRSDETLQRPPSWRFISESEALGHRLVLGDKKGHL